MNHIYQQPQFGEDWFTYADLYSYFVRNLKSGSKIVEIGSWKGKSIAYLAVEIINSGKDIKIDSVDTWRGSPEHQQDVYVKTDTLYNLFLTNISPISHVVKPVRMASVEAAELYEDNSLDVVFLDGCHEYECVREDLPAWYPKVKSGGWFAGHDYIWRHTDPLGPPVKRAVDEFKIEIQYISEQLCWVHKKP